MLGGLEAGEGGDRWGCRRVGIQWYRGHHMVQEGPGQPFTEESWRIRLMRVGSGCRLWAGVSLGYGNRRAAMEG